MGRRLSSRGPSRLFSVALVLWVLAVVAGGAGAEEQDFTCHGKGVQNNRSVDETAVILPRGDIVVEVGVTTKEVLCRFNDAFIDANDVMFATKEVSLASTVVNSSTIRLEVKHSEPERYTLYCKLRKSTDNRTMCSQQVFAGYAPKDVVNFSCLSIDNEAVNCSWEKPFNTLPTLYSPVTYSVPNFIKNTECPTSNPVRTFCSLDKSQRYKLRDNFDVHITAMNALGTKNFTHRVNIPENVVPKAVVSKVMMVTPLRAKVSWNLTYPMDVFNAGLWHFVEKRMRGDKQWQNVTTFFHISSVMEMIAKRKFSVETDLDYSFTTYEFRVRIHTGAGRIREDMWSPFKIISVTTVALAPSVAPETSLSTFEVHEKLDKRDIFVNFRDVEELERGGPGFSYSVDVFPSMGSPVFNAKPSEINHAFLKFTGMNFEDYRFRITPVNKKGPGSVHSEVVVPKSDCMPKKDGIFTVITTNTDDGRVFSLYWVPFSMPATRCPDSGWGIESYTLFWCKRTSGYRCKERLEWKEIPVVELSIKDLSRVTTDKVVIYERNMTELSSDGFYSFGIAANSGRYSSGIHWSSCIVDDSDLPLPPTTDIKSLTNDTESVYVSWSLQCMSISAVPVGFKVSYCKSRIADFGHCTSEVEHVEANSPSAKHLLVRNLDSGFSYIFSVAVLTIIGEGAMSPPLMIRLRNNIPTGPPTLVEVMTVRNTSVDLVWSPPEKVKRGGPMTDYRISISPQHLDDFYVKVDGEERVKYTVRGLKPFTPYLLRLSACNTFGCGYKHPASVPFKTTAGVPDDVDNFILDTSNWRLMWDLRHCNSRNCSFDLKLPFNETDYKYIEVREKETVNLGEVGVVCNLTQMSFSVRAKGQDRHGRFLYGNWSEVVKGVFDCPPAFLPWWAICIIVFICAAISAVALAIFKFGWRTIMQAMKDCNRSLNVPKGVAEPVKQPLREFSKPRATFVDPTRLSVNSSTQSLTERRNSMGKIRSESVSSDEVQLIGGEEGHSRHLSGSSSGHSSGRDSAVVADDPPRTFGAQNSLEAPSEDPSEDTLFGQDMSTGEKGSVPPYIQIGLIHDKISEGYVTAWSVPSLPRLYQKEQPGDDLGSSTPDLKKGAGVLNWKGARRASTGYISMPDSDHGGDVQSGTAPQPTLTHLPYSRHQFNPGLAIVPAPKSGYVTVTKGSSSPPGNNVGYVSAGDPMALKTFLFKGQEHEKAPPGAYCHVGPNGETATPGYVSASCIGKVSNCSPPSSPDAVERGKGGGPPRVNFPPSDLPSQSKMSPYVELTDGNRWAQTVHHRPFTTPSRNCPESKNARGRPSTTEATVGRTEKLPCLSKQSSGYVSQETVVPSESLLMSPKRLLSQATSPHTVVLSPSHEASMV